MTIDELIERHEMLQDVYVEVGAGWAELLDELCTALADTDPDVVVLQVKEKYGGLRFYVATASDETIALIDEAERQASVTCEQCGNPGHLRRGGWLRTLCNGCSDEEDYLREHLRGRAR